jgi:hypothetical protein
LCAVQCFFPFLLTLFYLTYLQEGEHFLSKTSTMYRLAICFFLPLINTLIVVRIHQNAFYHPHSFCSFILNATLSNEQSCIWECVYEHDCQTVVYFSDDKICSMFAELCTAGSIESSGDVRANTICYRKNPGESIFGYDVDEISFSSTCHYMFDHFNNEYKTRARNLNFG